jgi:hypothetical protein
MATNEGIYKFEIPLDATGIKDFNPEQPVKVAVQNRKGIVSSQIATFDARGRGVAIFKFPANPGALRIVVGPGDASEEELVGLQTINFELTARQWAAGRELRIPPIPIPPLLLVLVVAVVPNLHHPWGCPLPGRNPGPRCQSLRIRCGLVVVVGQHSTSGM